MSKPPRVTIHLKPTDEAFFREYKKHNQFKVGHILRLGIEAYLQRLEKANPELHTEFVKAIMSAALMGKEDE